MKKERIVVTGMGFLSSHGDTLTSFMDEIIQTKKRFSELNSFTFPTIEPPKGVEISIPAIPMSSEQRIIYLCEKAITDAINDGSKDLSRYRIAVIIGSGLGLNDAVADGIMVNDQSDYLSSLQQKIKDLISEKFSVNPEVIYISNACSAGSHAISYGIDLLSTSCFDLVIAGGVDVISKMAYAGFWRLNALDKTGCRPFNKKRKGIMVGEGAAFFMLEKASDDISNSKIYCEVCASVTNDAYHVVQMEPSGKQTKRAMTEALIAAELKKEDIGLIVAHGTGTELNDKTEARVIAEFFEDKIDNVAITAPKGVIGHTGGASGAFGLVTAIGSILFNVVPPIKNLDEEELSFTIPIVYNKPLRKKIEAAMVHAFAFGGTNVIITCKKGGRIA